ncbi:MAG: DUF2017 family protein [Ilumatobacteraceae bacterium]
MSRVDGGYVVRLDPGERELLIRLLAELTELLASGTAGPAMRRLFPPAYHLSDDAEAETEYQRLMHEELVASRLSAVTALTAALRDQSVLDEGGLTAFMQAVNSLRLVLGTMLDVDEEHDVGDVGDDHPLVGEHHLYGYLSYLLDAAVEVLNA